MQKHTCVWLLGEMRVRDVMIADKSNCQSSMALCSMAACELHTTACSAAQAVSNGQNQLRPSPLFPSNLHPSTQCGSKPALVVLLLQCNNGLALLRGSAPGADDTPALSSGKDQETP
jgi:hypothetical protein